MSEVDGLPLRYLIGKDDDPGVNGTCTLVGYDTSAVPPKGVGAGYINRRQEEGGRLPGVDYIDPPDDIEEEYGEPAPVHGTAYFWENLEKQANRLVRLGFQFAEIDNLDTDDVPKSLETLQFVAGFGLDLWIKNPHLVSGDSKQLVKFADGVGMIVEESDTTAKKLDDLRKAGGKPKYPIRVVSFGSGLPWAEAIAEQAKSLQLVDFGVTHSPSGEYASVVDILRPVMADPVPPTTVAKPWNATLEGDIGQFHDGPDVPMLAQQVARAFPDDAALAQYCTMAGNSTAWCGIYAAWKLSRFGLKPPHKDNSTGGFMYVDAWNDYGTGVSPSAREDGDLAIWLGNPHHISFCWQGKYLGGNQSDTVNISSFRTPDKVRRPPAPENYVPQPEYMPMLMIQSSGDAVRTLQTMLNEQINAGLDVDGEFGPLTEQAVKNYQTLHGLEVDGIVGAETWEALFSGMGPAPSPSPVVPLTSDQVVAIMQMASDSAIARYSWKDRGVAPIGYTQGLAVMFAQLLLKVRANDSAVLTMTQPIGASSKDALEYYGIQATGRENVLRKLVTLQYGLGMRESSGNYTEGRDMSASNVTADTAEAGCFQQSWNSANSSASMKGLLPAYQGNKQPCYVNVWKQGITPKKTQSYGSGPGYEFQELAKSCPAFATEMCGVGLRVLYNHWGPIIRKEAEFRSEAEALLSQVEAYMAAPPEPEPVPPDLTEVAEATRVCKETVNSAIDKLVADILKIAGGPSGTSRGSGTDGTLNSGQPEQDASGAGDSVV